MKTRKSCEIPKELFDYDEDKDSVIVKDETGFENFVDGKCRSRIDRHERKLEMKNKMLDQVRLFERRKRGISTGSMVSLTFCESPSRIRLRSTDSFEDEDEAKQRRMSFSKSVRN